MTLPTLRDWLFSAKAFAAAMLALYIALAIDLPRPYWAMTTVYVVMNPLSGATTSKAIFRAAGTFIGAVGAVVLVPALVNAPELLTFAIALWAGGFMYLAMMDRSPRGYVFMLAGYTLPLIALPALSAPSTIFDVALARTQEILLGITCASVVGAIVLPVSIGPVLGQRFAAWLKDAGAWAQEILTGEAPATSRQRLAGDIAALDMLVSQLSYDGEAHDMAGRARELRGRMLLLLPVLSSVADRLSALRLETGGLPPELHDLTQDIAAWIAGDAAPEAAGPLLARLAALDPPREELRQWDGLVRSSLVARLTELVTLWRDCRVQQRELAEGRPAAVPQASYRRRPMVGGTRHHDHAMLTFSAGSTVLATFLAGMLWIYSGWTGGAFFMAITAVACCFFGAMDQPATSMRTMLVWTGVALIGAGAYIFAVLPMVQDFEMLALVLAPPFLLIGLLVPRPQYFLITMMLATNGAGSLAVQSRYGGDFADYVDGGLAVLGGVFFALVWTLATRPFGAGLAARRLVRAGWADLAELASGARRRNHAALVGRTMDRLSQLVPRLASNDNRALAGIDGLAELRVGYNLLDLQRDRRALPSTAHGPIDRVFQGIAAHFHKLEAGATPSPELIEAIDAGIAAVAGEPGIAARDAAQALVGLRRGLFPGAAGPSADFLQPAVLMAAE
ncbi:FUSC family protein [Roseococcus pinisoli]|uniref:FUSC family protein n=1 Tax=Roseococcus pinisoli TaxID=2835040 RepID=A0ABS5QBS7_9PROT|nr:FUSC family protein [Roseococcus pinisoli]